MRLVIDLQGAQASNRDRGIGRYATSLVKAMLEIRGEHDVILVLNSLFPETIEPIRAEFGNFLPSNKIQVWTAPSTFIPNDDEHRQITERMREAFISSLQPDALLITSIFEGGEHPVTSIGTLSTALPTAVILYDLIPLIHKDIYLTSPASRRWYLNKLDHLKRADVLLAISQSSAQEAHTYLGFPTDQVTNISAASDSHFIPLAISQSKRDELSNRYGLQHPFVMYTGGIDHRKNIEKLIVAYAALPISLRKSLQLAIICSIDNPETLSLERIAKDAGLSSYELILTGFVPEEDLVALYNTCELFVFPSWHEGFGLPALEAMACGRAVIGANTSSIPEVIGNPTALFDPYDEYSITNKIFETLTDTSFRCELESHASIQAKKFSWNHSAKQAWKAVSKLEKPSLPISLPHRPSLAYISPLPPAKSGIADYSAELLPELSRHYKISVITDQSNAIEDPWVLSNCQQHDIDWFRSHSCSFDRVIYHFGNSDFHSGMFQLLEEIPGVVVLHDFYLSGVISHLDVHGQKPGVWAQELLSGHGWPAVHSRYTAKDTAHSVWTYPCNFSVLQNALGIIVHSKHSKELANEWYGEGASETWVEIPHLRDSSFPPNRQMARLDLGIGKEQLLVCSFGLLGPTKLNHRLLEAWESSPLSSDPNSVLVFVGQNTEDEYGVQLVQSIRNSSSNIRITGWTDMECFRQWLAAADIAVQLRTRSRGETSGTVLDCMNYGLPTIVNANGSMGSLPDDAVLKIPDNFDNEELVASLTTLWRNQQFRQSLGTEGHKLITTQHQPRKCADLYKQAIEGYYANAKSGLMGLIESVDNSISYPIEDVQQLARCCAENFPSKSRRPQLLIDISELVQKDVRSGIQRVVRSLLFELLKNPPTGWQVEAVYATSDSSGYRYARKYTCDFLELPSEWAEDSYVETWSGDVFWALDLQPMVLSAQIETLTSWRNRGVKVFAAVYDLLPILQPDSFVPGAGEGHHTWLESISKLDGALTISASVADELYSWLEAAGPKDRKLPFEIHHFHLGADIENSSPSTGLPENAETLIQTAKRYPTFLMVGTIEPRKGHSQTIRSFETLWEQGNDVALIIVGSQGWMVESLVEKLRHHPENGKRLFWLENLSDEFLETIYALSTCLIASSEGEGFGLPLIEAARNNLPILARDIPVFREVAQDSAAYFSNDRSTATLTKAIKSWLELYHQGKHLKSIDMPWLNWHESTKQAVGALLNERPHKTWCPSETQRYWGNDVRLKTEVGKRRGWSISTTGEAGLLIYGPNQQLKANYYRISLEGTAKRWGGNEKLEITHSQGAKEILYSGLPQCPTGSWKYQIEFESNNDITDFEIRIWVDMCTEISLESIEIEAIPKEQNMCHSATPLKARKEELPKSETRVSHDQFQ